MPKMIFISLPVADLATSIAFCKALGFEQAPHFSDGTGACMVWSEAITVIDHARQMTHVHAAAVAAGRGRAGRRSGCRWTAATPSMRRTAPPPTARRPM